MCVWPTMAHTKALMVYRTDSSTNEHRQHIGAEMKPDWQRVLDVLEDGQWHSTPEIAQKAACQHNSVQRALHHLRGRDCGKYSGQIESRRKSGKTYKEYRKSTGQQAVSGSAAIRQIGHPDEHGNWPLCEHCGKSAWVRGKSCNVCGRERL